MLTFLIDMYSCVEQVSLTFQARSLMIATVGRQVDLSGALRVRYTTALSDPIVVCFKIFLPLHWPQLDKNESKNLDAFGTESLLKLIDNYSCFFEGDGTVQCQRQFKKLKRHIQGEADLWEKPFEDFWPAFLVEEYQHGQYNIIFWLIIILLLFACDTSECAPLQPNEQPHGQQADPHEALRAPKLGVVA